MPIKLNKCTVKLTYTDQMLEICRALPADEGLTLDEMMEKIPGVSASHLFSVGKIKKCSVRVMAEDITHRSSLVTVFVNPQHLKKWL